MKNSIIMLLFAAYISNAAFAQKISVDKVPAPVMSAFKAKFPMLGKVKWEMESANEYEAGFKSNGVKQSASFDQNGKWIETETEIKVSQLPTVVQQSIAKQFAGFKIEEASKVESAQYGNCYDLSSS